MADVAAVAAVANVADDAACYRVSRNEMLRRLHEGSLPHMNVSQSSNSQQ